MEAGRAGGRPGRRPEEELAPGLAELFEELEQQAAGLHLAEREEEVAARLPGEYAGVTLAARLHASVGADLQLAVEGVGHLRGRLEAVGDGWVRVHGDDAAWTVRLAAVAQLRGLSPLAVHETAQPVTARLGFGSALRPLADAGEPVSVHQRSGARLVLRILRVGADFLEALPAGAEGGAEGAGLEGSVVLPVRTVAAVRSAR